MSADEQASFDFQYVLEGHGWATAVLDVGGTKVEMTSSDCGDPIKELLIALLNLRKGFSRVKTLFVDEPGEHLLEVSLLTDKLITIELLWFDDWESHDPNAKRKKLLSAIVSHDEFEAAILKTVRGLRDAHGLKGYKRKWEHGFPTMEFDALMRDKT